MSIAEVWLRGIDPDQVSFPQRQLKSRQSANGPLPSGMRPIPGVGLTVADPISGHPSEQARLYTCANSDHCRDGKISYAATSQKSGKQVSL
jgi:hypothetical protein